MVFEALFWAQIELSIVSKVKGIKRQIGLVTTIFLSAYFVSAYFWFPLNIGTGLTTAVFLYIGYLIKKYNIMEKDNRNWMVIAISLSSICVIIAFVKGKPFVPAYLEYPLYGFDIIGGVSGTYLIYLLSKYICKKSKRLVKVLSYIGNRTTEILCFHLIDQDCLSLLLPLPNSNILRLIIRLIIDIVGGIGLHLLLQKRGITMSIKQVIKKVSVVNNLNWGISLFQYYRNEHRECSALKFILQNVTRLKSIHPFDNKWNQIEALMNSVDILPNQNSSFFILLMYLNVRNKRII